MKAAEPEVKEESEATEADAKDESKTTAPETPVKKEMTNEEVQEKLAERFFSGFYPQNMPDISGATVARLSPKESKAYSREMESSEYLIVVHCTHGMNRAGYMISRFLIDRLGLDNEKSMNVVGEVIFIDMETIRLY